MEVSYENGGMIDQPVLELNGDERINESDKTSTGEVPGGIYLGEGKSTTPVISEVDKEREVKFISKTRGELEIVIERHGKTDTGIFYWEEVF